MGIATFFKRLFGSSNASSTNSKGSGEGTELHCAECKRSFYFEPGEQKFYKIRGLTPPKRCPSCRGKKRRHRRSKPN